MEEYYNKATKRERDEVMNEENKKQNKEDEFSNTIEDNFLDLENYSFDNNFFIDTFESHQRHDVGRMMQQGEEEKATQQEKKKKNTQKQKFITTKNYNSQQQTQTQQQQMEAKENTMHPSETKYTVDILRKKKVTELKHILENYCFYNKFIHFHWTWMQKKNDLIQVLLDPTNPKFKASKPTK